MKTNFLKITLLIVLFALSLTTFAEQTIVIFGNISDAEGSPVANQEVEITRGNTIITAITGEEGDYMVTITAEGDSIVFLVQTYVLECNELYSEYVVV